MVSLRLTDSGRSTTGVFSPPPPIVPRNSGSFSTMANPPESRFSQPLSGVVSVSESWRYAARLRLFEKLSMSRFSRAPVRGICEASVSHRISAPYSHSAECEGPVPTHPPDKTENAPPRATRHARAYGLLPSEMTASLGKQAEDILVPNAQSAVHKPKPRPAPSSEGHGEHYSSRPKTRGASMVVRMGIGA